MKRWHVLLFGLVALGALVCGRPGGSSLSAGEAGKTPVNLAVTANNDFAFDLYGRLVQEKPDKPLFFSPWSISNALTIVAEGARKQTLDEMGKALRFPSAMHRAGNEDQPWNTDLIHPGIAALNKRFEAANRPAAPAVLDKLAALRKELAEANAEAKSRRDFEAMKRARQLADEINKIQAKINPYELRVANALWAEKTYPFKQSFLDSIKKHYGVAAFPVDFLKNYEAERKKINAWVEKQTREHIKTLIPKGSIDDSTTLVVTNAIYFKGEWLEPFKKANTKDEPFTLADGKKVKVATMSANTGAARYAAFNKDGSLFDTPQRISRGEKDTSRFYPDSTGFELLELPYKGGDLAMVVLVPRSANGLPALEKMLTAGNLRTWVGNARQRSVHVFLPKFKLESSLDLKKPLQALGMKRAFNDPRQKDGAQFDGMSQSEDPMQKLYISKVLHKGFVEVSEKGTEAAAATAVIMARPTSAVLTIRFTPTFKAERPFVFLIKDQQTGSILFLGRMMNPGGGS